jgi:hypothetical protein
VLQLRDENMTLLDKQQAAGYDEEEVDIDSEIAELHRVATGHEKFSIELTSKLEEVRGEVHELRQQLLALPPKREVGPKGPAKRGTLTMGAKVPRHPYVSK